MKKYLLYLFVLIISSSFAVISFTQIVSAIKSGNATEVSKNFDNSVEITLHDKGNSYSKSEAQLVLQEFLKNKPVKDFKFIHQSENTGSEYCIGNLTTTNGVFR